MPKVKGSGEYVTAQLPRDSEPKNAIVLISHTGNQYFLKEKGTRDNSRGQYTYALFHEVLQRAEKVYYLVVDVPYHSTYSIFFPPKDADKETDEKRNSWLLSHIRSFKRLLNLPEMKLPTNGSVSEMISSINDEAKKQQRGFQVGGWNDLMAETDKKSIQAIIDKTTSFFSVLHKYFANEGNILSEANLIEMLSTLKNRSQFAESQQKITTSINQALAFLDSEERVDLNDRKTYLDFLGLFQVESTITKRENLTQEADTRLHNFIAHHFIDAIEFADRKVTKQGYHSTIQAWFWANLNFLVTEGIGLCCMAYQLGYTDMIYPGKEGLALSSTRTELMGPYFKHEFKPWIDVDFVLSEKPSALHDNDVHTPDSTANNSSAESSPASSPNNKSMRIPRVRNDDDPPAARKNLFGTSTLEPVAPTTTTTTVTGLDAPLTSSVIEDEHTSRIVRLVISELIHQGVLQAPNTAHLPRARSLGSLDAHIAIANNMYTYFRAPKPQSDFETPQTCQSDPAHAPTHASDALDVTTSRSRTPTPIPTT